MAVREAPAVMAVVVAAEVPAALEHRMEATGTMVWMDGTVGMGHRGRVDSSASPTTLK